MSLKSRMMVTLSGLGIVFFTISAFFSYRSTHATMMSNVEETAQNLLNRSVQMFMVSTVKFHDQLNAATTAADKKKITDDWNRSITAVDQAVIHDFGAGVSRVRLIGDEKIFGYKPFGGAGTRILNSFEERAARELQGGTTPVVRAIEDGCLKIALPLPSDAHPGCAECHAAPLQGHHILGTLNAYIPLEAKTNQARSDAAWACAFMGLMILGMIAAIARLISSRVVRPVGAITRQLQQNAIQMTQSAGEVSNSSQLVADGTSRQAAAIEETASALEEMTAMARANATHAREANDLASATRHAADEGDTTMTQLNQAMANINTSSVKIGKIIKVIDEIAFQTNLLALNAAVEAARAGEHGKGFAVVADEVRNLAVRAAQAACETTDLIQDAIQNANNGTGVATHVGKILSTIVTHAGQVSGLVNQIAHASGEQTHGIEQINQAVSQIDTITQQNASTAEESASTGQELNHQSRQLGEAVGELVVLVTGKK